MRRYRSSAINVSRCYYVDFASGPFRLGLCTGVFINKVWDEEKHGIRIVFTNSFIIAKMLDNLYNCMAIIVFINIVELYSKLK